MKRTVLGLALACFAASPVLAAATADTASVALKPDDKRKYTVKDAVPGKDGVRRMAVLRGLDKITARPTTILAPVGVPVEFATLTITVRYCYSTPQSEAPETTAFVQITDHRPDKPSKKVFSGWMLASSPSYNGLEHPLYDVWVISCKTDRPGDESAPIASATPVKPKSPDAAPDDAPVALPEDAGQ